MSSLDEGMMTAADVVALLEDHGVDVEDAREVVTTLDGDHVRARLSITAPVGADIADADDETEADDGPATDEDVAESVDDLQTDPGEEFLSNVEDASDLDDGDADTDSGGRDEEVLPEFEDLVDDEPDEPDDGEENADEADANDEPAPETGGSDGDDGDGATNELGWVTVKSYGITLNGDVADHFDTDRVTVVDRPHGADLVPGTDAEGPDYAVGRSQVQLGDPGRREIGVDVEDRIRAIPDGDSVRLEPVDGAGDEDPDSDGTEDDEDGLWCGVCGEGGFATAGEVEDHHDGAGHAGDPIASAANPAEGDLVPADDDHRVGDPVDELEDGLWCGVCGEGPFDKDGLNGHNTADGHPDEPVALDHEPEQRELVGPDTDDIDADAEVAKRLPDDVTVDDVHAALDERGKNCYLGAVAEDLGMEEDPLRTVLFHISRYAWVIDASGPKTHSRGVQGDD
ncbi:hypothetical protein [Halosimplex pelagicum]|uniref:Uncharacterized protein n=1 Tax=Halosimplex pelagicum TaxID=869886 RepID=A0A7D5T5M9_9EURY|nr:hypothetical protein [Halosimplex pelagicum]QLH82432.1 hypothetical protein HZS54_12755 [Halosimplex pelagicum]QLH82488.1 hypothetical protein HZS54_13060 [Halosimplex pelagicum]